MRVEEGLDAAHEPQLHIIQRDGYIGPLHQADAMLPGDGATQAYAQPEYLFDALGQLVVKDDVLELLAQLGEGRLVGLELLVPLGLNLST